jgi:hypothetical protein
MGFFNCERFNTKLAFLGSYPPPNGISNPKPLLLQDFNTSAPKPYQKSNSELPGRDFTDKIRVALAEAKTTPFEAKHAKS